MSVTAVIGARWGDKGKGKILDLLTDQGSKMSVTAVTGARWGDKGKG